MMGERILKPHLLCCSVAFSLRRGNTTPQSQALSRLASGAFKCVLVGMVMVGIRAKAQPASTPQPKEITIGVTPFGDKIHLKKSALDLARQLQAEIHVPVNIFVPKSYGSLLQAFRDKKMDFAFLTSSSYVQIEKTTPVQILLKQVWDEPFYYSVIVVKDHSKIKKLEDLRGKKIAFVDRKSTSGYLYPQAMLKSKGWTDSFFSKIEFSGSHAQSVQSLLQGQVDAIAVFSDDKEGKKGAWTKLSSEGGKPASVRVLWESEPIPNDPFCVRQEFYDQYPKLVHSVMFAMIDSLDQLKGHTEVTEVFGKAFLPATSKQYDPVRELVKQLGGELD